MTALADPPTTTAAAAPPLRGRDAAWLVARREFVERGRDRSFLVSTGVMLVILLAIVVVPHLFGGNNKQTLGVVGPDAERIVASAAVASEHAKGPALVSKRFTDAAAARAAVRAGTVEAAVLGGKQVVVKQKLDPEVATLLTAAAQQRLIAQRLTEAGVPPAQAREALTTPPLHVTALEPQSQAHQDAQGIATVAVILLYGQFIGYGMWVALGVVEEKSTRVVEVLLSTVRPRELLAGKVAGIGLLGLVQLVVVAVVGLAVALAIGAVHLSGTAVTTLGQVVLWFLLGFAFFAMLFAAAASTVSRQEDLNTVTTPLTLVLVALLFVGIHAAKSPSAASSVVFSFLPPFSAVAMPPRWAAGDAALWQVGVAAVLMLLAVAGITEIGARIYARTILRLGARVPWRQALRRQT